MSDAYCSITSWFWKMDIRLRPYCSQMFLFRQLDTTLSPYCNLIDVESFTSNGAPTVAQCSVFVGTNGHSSSSSQCFPAAPDVQSPSCPREDFHRQPHIVHIKHSTPLYCTSLHSAVLHCSAMRWTEIHCTALHCTLLHFNMGRQGSFVPPWLAPSWCLHVASM